MNKIQLRIDMNMHEMKLNTLVSLPRLFTLKLRVANFFGHYLDERVGNQQLF